MERKNVKYMQVYQFSTLNSREYVIYHQIGFNLGENWFRNYDICWYNEFEALNKPTDNLNPEIKKNPFKLYIQLRCVYKI